MERLQAEIRNQPRYSTSSITAILITEDMNTKIVMDALISAKSADIPAILQQLNDSQVDTLAKYIYKGMSFPETFNPAQLLVWHEKTVELGGVGCIMRVLTDKKTV
jgi:hypothetical protein